MLLFTLNLQAATEAAPTVSGAAVQMRRRAALKLAEEANRRKEREEAQREAQQAAQDAMLKAMSVQPTAKAAVAQVVALFDDEQDIEELLLSL